MRFRNQMRFGSGKLRFVLFALLGSLAVVARAQEIPAPDPEPTPYLSLEGQPPGYRPYATLSYFLWHDGGGWHLRATTASHFHRFHGTIRAEQGLSDVRPLDPSISLQIGQNQIGFDFSVAGGEKGFDWQSPGAGCAMYSLSIDGQDRPGKVTVGGSQGHPNFGGFQLCAGGQDIAAPEEVSAVEGPSVEPTTFRTTLSPYGEWVDVPGYGVIWRPYATVVGPDFVPYGSSGHWVYTDAGWMWASGYGWGWAPFHYGNWVYAGGGWGWIPGSVWAPAWVEWRSGGGYVGWAPLAPVGVVVVNAPVSYTYVQVNNFTAVNVQQHVIVGAQAQVIYAQTQPLPSARVVNGHPIAPVNAGPQPAVISQATGHPVTPVAAHTVTASVPPPTAAGVKYPVGASAQHPVAVKPLPPAAAKQYVAAARAAGVPVAHNQPATGAAAAVGSSAHAQPATTALGAHPSTTPGTPVAHGQPAATSTPAAAAHPVATAPAATAHPATQAPPGRASVDLGTAPERAPPGHTVAPAPSHNVESGPPPAAHPAMGSPPATHPAMNAPQPAAHPMMNAPPPAAKPKPQPPTPQKKK
jgi:hypothetical protein